MTTIMFPIYGLTVLISAFEFHIQNKSNFYLPCNFKVSKLFLNKKSCKKNFVKGSKFIYFGKPFLLHRYTFLIGWVSLDYDLFHYIRLLYTGCALDYALSFYRRTINFVFIILHLLTIARRL